MGKKSDLRFLRMILILMLCFSWGCTAGARSRMMVNSMKPLIESINIAARKNIDIEIVRDSMPMGLLQMDGLIEASPDDKFLLATAAENYHAYAFFFVEPENKDASEGLYLRSRNYAFRALNQNTEYKKAGDGSLEDFTTSLESFEKEDVPALYWAAASWLAWMRVSHSSGLETMIAFPKIEAMMDRMLVLDETWNYGAVHVLMGAYYSHIPDSFGGNYDEVVFHFNEAFEISESKYLLWHVFYAQYYTFAVQDKKLFIESLNYVMSAPEDVFPEEVFANLVAKQKAERLLKDTDLMF
ncbi:MAG: hypothetical protein KAH06_06865 [Desulfobacterales bacterium]|nr:hypothetical protein [Desulfobacterales bacterium]